MMKQIPIFMVKPLIVVLLLLVALAGCGVYTFNPQGKSSIKSIAVERFANDTPEYGLADLVTDLVIDSLFANGSVKVLSPENAEAILIGRLTRYERRPYTYDENDNVSEYAVHMDFKITLKNPKDDSDMWSETMRQTGVFDVETETEEQGQQSAIGFLVESIINRTTKSW